MKRPALTENRIRCLKALADHVRPRLPARGGVFRMSNHADIREAVRYIDDLEHWKQTQKK